MSKRSKEAPGFNPLLLVTALTVASCSIAPPPPEIVPDGEGGYTVVYTQDGQRQKYCLAAQPNAKEAYTVYRDKGKLLLTWPGLNNPIWFYDGETRWDSGFHVEENPGDTPDEVRVGPIWSPGCKSNGSRPIPPTIGPTLTPQPTLRPGEGGIQAYKQGPDLRAMRPRAQLANQR